MANVKVPALLYKMSKASQKAWYKKNNMKMPDEPVERSAAAAKRVKVAPRKASDVKPDSVRAINTARMAAYMAKGGRAPIGAAGSGGNSVMAGSNMSTVRGIITGIKAGFNPTVSLDPYESERAKKTGPRSLKLKKEEAEQVDEAGKGYSPGWMLKHPDGKKLALELKRKKELERKRQKSYGDPSAGISVKKEEVEQVDEGRFRRSMRGYAAPSFFGNSRPVRYQSSGERSREMNVGLDDKQEKENARRAAEADKAKMKKEEVGGKVAVTPKEKALAAHHGDKTKITYGDVIKARLKSVAAKAMNKGK